MRIEAREEKNQEEDGDLSGEDGGIEEKLAKVSLYGNAALT